jgi:mycoredoxin
MHHHITMYTTDWCGDCRTARRFLKSLGIEFNEINIDQNPAAAQQVINWSGGRRVIPTFDIRTPEGQAIILHNPGLHALALALGIGEEVDNENH